MHIARKSFAQASIIADDRETCWQAMKHAAGFWFHIARTDNQLNTSVRDALIDLSHASRRDEKPEPVMIAA